MNKFIEKIIIGIAECMMLLIYLFLLYYGFMTVERLIRFLLILLAISLYSLIYKIFEIILNDWIEKKKEEKVEDKKKWAKEIYDDLNIIISVYEKINIVFYLLINLSYNLFFFIRWINSKVYFLGKVIHLIILYFFFLSQY